MPKIEYSAVPAWFFQSNMFQLETNQANKNYKSPKQMVYDYDSFPTFSAPSNKIAVHGEYRYDHLKAIENDATRYDPSERVGYTHFPKFTGIVEGQNIELFNAYPASRQADIVTEGGNVASNNLGFNSKNMKYQIFNGETGWGYGSITNPTYIQRMNDFLNQCRSLQPNSKFSDYALEAFPLWSKFYQAKDGNESVVNELCGYLTTPPDSNHAICGFDFLCEDLYPQGSGQSQFYGALGIYFKQLARKKFLLTGNPVYQKMAYLIWSHSENFGFQYKYRKAGVMVTNGELDGLSKAPANVNHNYNVALHAMTGGDMLLHFDDRTGAFGDVNINGTMRDLELENTNHEITVTIKGQTYRTGPQIIWLGANMYSSLAIWQAAQHKSIIEDTTYDWFTPDFVYEGNTRTGNFKQIPYNMLYKEPTLEVKYSADKSSCLIYACNFVTQSTTPKIVNAIVKNAANQDVQIPIILKGTKAELVKYTF